MCYELTSLLQGPSGTSWRAQGDRAQGDAWGKAPKG
jgi:hypothetical protein